MEREDRELLCERAGMGRFAKVQFRKRMSVVHWSGTLKHVSLYGGKNLDRRYGDGVMSVSVKEVNM